MSMKRWGLGCAVAAVCVGALVSGASAADAKKGPPACSAISFRPVPPGMPDGVREAGMYHSRFGQITLQAEVSGGQAHNYYIEINGKRPEPLKGALPASVNPCLNSKHVKTPPPPAGDTCTGERFRVVIDHAGAQRYLMLFGLQGDTWKLCSASKT